MFTSEKIPPIYVEKVSHEYDKLWQNFNISIWNG